MSWCTIESDPVVFNEMLERIGVEGAEVVEVPVLDAGELEKMGSVYGLIFLFKWKPVQRDVAVVEDPSVYFAKQTVTNACATQAIINILLNFSDKLKLGTVLTDFKSFTDPLPPDQRGDCMGNEETLRTVHNSFARPQTFTFEESASSDEDAYHFTAYIEKEGRVYELDGLQRGPILAGDAKSGVSWLHSAVPLLQDRVAQVQSLDTKGNGLMFSLLAVAEPQIARLQKQIAGGQLGEAERVSAEDRILMLQEARDNGRKENKRRRHNYIPLVVACLKALAEKGQLAKIADSAHARAVEKHEQKKAAKKS